MDDYEVEVVLIVTAPSRSEAIASLDRSGIRQGVLIGEAMVEHIEVYSHGDEDA